MTTSTLSTLNGAVRENTKLHRARLLSDDAETIGRIFRVSRQARSAGCVLTQSRPLRIEDMSSRAAAALAYERSNLAPAPNAGENSLRITCVDRAIMRAYFHPPEAGILAPSEKSAEFEHSAPAREDREADLLPDELERKLTPLPAGYLRLLRGNAVYLVQARTHEIIDAAPGVLVE